MSFLARALMFRVSHCTTSSEGNKHNENEHRKFERTPGVPAIPIDIGFKSGKETGGSHSTGVSEGMASNPLVPIGMGLTVMALLGMLKNSYTGDKMGAQKYMRYRIYAQFGTVLALVAGFAYAGSVIAGGKQKKE